LARRIRYTATFISDLARETAWLAAVGQASWIEILEEDLRRAEALLKRFPEAGYALERGGTEALRKLALRRAPFNVWYALDRTTADVPIDFVRLFHVRQKAGPP